MYRKDKLANKSFTCKLILDGNIFASLVLCFPLTLFAQSYVDQQVNLANTARRNALEAIARSEAHVKDIQGMGDDVWKSHFDVVYAAIQDCKKANQNSSPVTNKYEPKNSQEINRFLKQFEDQIQQHIASIGRVSLIFEQSKTSACYPGYERNLGAYIDCQHAHYKYLASLSSVIGAKIMLGQYQIIKKKAEEYIQCTVGKNYIKDKHLEEVANSVDKVGAFYINMAKMFSKEANAIK